ncbi:MAG: hypothetical protein C0623_04875 [Desulfuromonas sp.]|nr:MAG: hypothetical protein C0623_04875 [Desulfuromonas sp.]
MDVECRYGFGKKSESSFQEVLARVEKLLHSYGFEIHSRINVADIFSGKDDLPFKRYLIIGACRPDFAEEAFTADPNIGLLLPCNIVIYEDFCGQVTIMAKDPVHMMDLLEDPRAVVAASKVKFELEQLIEEF